MPKIRSYHNRLSTYEFPPESGDIETANRQSSRLVESASLQKNETHSQTNASNLLARPCVSARRKEIEDEFARMSL
jgi:hypothetical protein